MKYSIVIPSYNGEKFIYEAVMSACVQERPADEIIVCDDCSTDGTVNICQCDEFKGKIKIFINDDGPSGFVGGWNKAIRNAKCDYVVLLHQDDVLESSYLKVIDEALRKYPDAGHIYSACNYIDENGKIIKYAPKPYSLNPILYTGKEYAHNYLMSVSNYDQIHRCPGVTTSKIILDICGYREQAGHIADNDFYFRVGKHTDVVGISAPLANYRHHSYSETGQLERRELVLRLANDYVYQSKFHSDYKYFVWDDVVILNKIAIRYINELLYCGIKHKNNQYINCAINLRNDLFAVQKYETVRDILWIDRLMWCFTCYCSRLRLHYLYGDFINQCRVIKNVIRGIIKI